MWPAMLCLFLCAHSFKVKFAAASVHPACRAGGQVRQRLGRHSLPGAPLVAGGGVRDAERFPGIVYARDRVECQQALKDSVTLNSFDRLYHEDAKT